MIDVRNPAMRNSLLTGIGILLVLLLACAGKIIESVDANQVVVIQGAIDGELHWYTQPGVYFQWFGKVTPYKKSFQFWFSKDGETGLGEPIRVRFNDNGHANIAGSARIDLPLDNEHLTMLHTKFGSQETIEHELILPIMKKSIYTTGPLMSSTQSASERRNELLAYIEDQALQGVYKTTRKDTKEKDILTGNDKTVTYVELVPDSSAPSGKARAEKSPLESFGIKMYNISISEIIYDETVESQIQLQQKAIMGVQIAIADAKKAEQRAITVEQEGKAEAAKARWEQEVAKATEVTQAEKFRDVARLDLQRAELERLAMIQRAQGEATKRQLEIQSNGALEQKLAAWVEVNKAAWTALANNQLVPTVIFGNSGAGGGMANGASNANALIDMLSAKTAKDLGLDLSIKK